MGYYTAVLTVPAVIKAFSMRILWTYLKPHWRLGLLALVFAGIAQVLALVDPIIFGTIIDHVTGRHRQPKPS
jgi:ABC-type bacteriocin/lantibiotic exporter with double-glycine peptidase domain